MKVKTDGQEFETPDGYTYFGYKDGRLGFHVTLVEGKVTVYFAGAKLELGDKETVRIL
jgi:hypothetical protein